MGENVFYINGLNITNFVNGIGAAVVPFEFYKSVEVKTGGYPAEFGRGTGAMINAVTKSGSNDFTFALHGNYEPDAWRERIPDTTNARNALAHRTDNNLTVEAGGPIIRDRLFFYGLASFQELKAQNAINNEPGPGVTRRSADQGPPADPFYALKLDAYVTDRQHLELTYFDTSRKRKRDTYQYLLANNEILPARFSADSLYQAARTTSRAHRDLHRLADPVGRLRAARSTTSRSATCSPNPSSRTTAPERPRPSAARRPARPPCRRWPTASSTAPTPTSISSCSATTTSGAASTRKTLLTQFTVRNGERNWIYRKAGASGAQGGAIGAGQEYVEMRRFETGGGYSGKNKAYYIQDAWDVTDDLTLNLGVRKDQFKVKNPLGQAFSSFDDEVALRLGFAYDLFGARTDKLYGLVRSHLPARRLQHRVPGRVSGHRRLGVLLPGRRTGFDLHPGPVDRPADRRRGRPGDRRHLVPCVATVKSIAPVGTNACVIRNNGLAPAPDTVSALNLKSTYQDEYIDRLRAPDRRPVEGRPEPDLPQPGQGQRGHGDGPGDPGLVLGQRLRPDQRRQDRLHRRGTARTSS